MSTKFGNWEPRIITDGVMVVTPPYEEKQAAIESGRSVTTKRICIIGTSAYMTRQQAEEIGRLIAASPRMLDALQNLVDHFDRIGITREEDALLDAAMAAIALTKS